MRSPVCSERPRKCWRCRSWVLGRFGQDVGGGVPGSSELGNGYRTEPRKFMELGVDHVPVDKELPQRHVAERVAILQRGLRIDDVLVVDVVEWPGLVLRTRSFESCWSLLVVLCPLARVLVGYEPAQRAVGVFFIVAARPGDDERARVVEVLEHVVFQEFITHAVV